MICSFHFEPTRDFASLVYATDDTVIDIINPSKLVDDKRVGYILTPNFKVRDCIVFHSENLIGPLMPVKLVSSGGKPVLAAGVPLLEDATAKRAGVVYDLSDIGDLPGFLVALTGNPYIFNEAQADAFIQTNASILADLKAHNPTAVDSRISHLIAGYLKENDGANDDEEPDAS